jgi:hypothetical protein
MPIPFQFWHNNWISKLKIFPMKKLTLLCIISIVIISCKQIEGFPIPDGNNFYFEYPQPINDSELSSFPNKFKGVYMSLDSLFLNITNNMIFSEREYKFRFHKTQLDSLKEYFDAVDGKYISKDTKEIFNSKKVGDSIEFASKNRDTIFKFSETQKAKRINGFLVINQKDSIFWKVKLVSLDKNKLIIKQLYSDDDLKRMDSITKIHSKKLDSTSFIISPKRKEFNQFFKLKKFGFDQEYRKISK